MYDFEGFERREMALQRNAQEHADNIHAQIAAEDAGDNVKLAELEKESARIWAEKQAIYDGNLAVQTEVANRGLSKGRLFMKMTGGTIYGNHLAVLDRELYLELENIPENRVNIGKYGEMRSRWLVAQKMNTEQDALILTGHPNRELAFFNAIVAEEVSRIWFEIMEKDKANEPKGDYWAHVRWMNGHKATAEEIVVNEMVYVK